MKVPAWIISLTDNVSAAVGEFELVHILPDIPVLIEIPKTPIYCNKVFVWQHKIIPMMDIAVRFASTQSNTNPIVGIFAYRTQAGLVEYGALLLTTMPRRLEVSDEQACALPTDLQHWRPYIKCCFQETQDQVIPILNIERLFVAQ
jgi:chemotaxis signal transduction protein